MRASRYLEDEPPRVHPLFQLSDRAASPFPSDMFTVGDGLAFLWRYAAGFELRDHYCDRSLITSNYHAVAVQLHRPLTNGLQLHSSYTLSKASDNGQSSSIYPSNNYPSNPLDVSDDHGPADFDARHKFTASAVWSAASLRSNRRLVRAILDRFTISTILLARSGLPYSAGVGGASVDGLRAGITGGGQPGLSHFRCSRATSFDCRRSSMWTSGSHSGFGSRTRRTWRSSLTRSTFSTVHRFLS